MNVNFDLPDEFENVLSRRAATAGTDLATFVRQVVTESLIDADEDQPRTISPAEFSRRLDSWIALHPVLDHPIDDSRESIYAGRGKCSESPAMSPAR